MSSIAMAADSTQNDYYRGTKNKQKRKKHRSYSTSSYDSSENSRSTQPNKRHKKISTKGSKVDSSDSNRESDLDLSKELLPISGYINDKEAMLENMFKSITSKKLKTMLPEVLQTLPTKELKMLCLGQLHMMSSMRIIKILEGAHPDADSSASEEGIHYGADKESITFTCSGVISDEKAQVGLTSKFQADENSEKISKSFLQQDKEQSKVHWHSKEKADIQKTKEHLIMQDKMSTLPGEQKSLKEIEFDKDLPISSKEISENKVLERGVCKNSANNRVSKDKDEMNNAIKGKFDEKKGASKTQLEILELEMRARAIKAMLKAQEENDKSIVRRPDEETKFHASHSDNKNQLMFEQVDYNDKDVLRPLEVDNHAVKHVSTKRGNSPLGIKSQSRSFHP